MQPGGGQRRARHVPSRDWWPINQTSDAGHSQRDFSTLTQQADLICAPRLLIVEGIYPPRIDQSLELSRAYRGTTLLMSADFQMHQVDAPSVPAAEMKTAVRWRVKDIIDYPLDAATVDVLDIPIDRNAPARNHSVYAITARNSSS